MRRSAPAGFPPVRCEARSAASVAITRQTSAGADVATITKGSMTIRAGAESPRRFSSRIRGARTVLPAVAVSITCGHTAATSTSSGTKPTGPRNVAAVTAGRLPNTMEGSVMTLVRGRGLNLENVVSLRALTSAQSILRNMNFLGDANGASTRNFVTGKRFDGSTLRANDR
jgi:hypothetical protein